MHHKNFIDFLADFDAISQNTFISNQSAEEESEYYVKLKCKCRKCTIEKYLKGENCNQKCPPQLTLKLQKPAESKLSTKRCMPYQNFMSINRELSSDMNAHYQNLLSTAISDLEKQYPFDHVKKQLESLINAKSSRCSSYSRMYKTQKVHLRQVCTYSDFRNFLDQELCCWFNIDAISHLRETLLFQDKANKADKICIAYNEHTTNYIRRSCIYQKICDAKKRPMYTKII